MILRTSIKCWPVEYHAQSAVEASVALRQQVADPSEIKSVLIESHDAAVDIIGSEPEKWRPATRETADHSLPYLVAVALTDGEVAAGQFSRERLADPRLIELVQRVKVQRRTDLSARYPEAVANIVTAQLQGGRTQSQRVDYPHGHAKNPLTDAEVETKFYILTDPRLGRERAEAALSWLWRLEQARELGEFPPLIEVS